MRKADEKVYIAIKNFINQYNYAPTIRQLCELTGLSSTSTVKARLDSLEKSGYIYIDKDDNNKSLCRTIKIIK